MVKLLGYRIELAEVEAHLCAHPDVAEAVADFTGSGSGDRRLVAHVVARPGTSISTKELRLFLSERVPDYMVPSAFGALERLPLNRNGKVDRRSLPDPWAARRGRDDDFVPPRNRIEEVLVEAWQAELGLERIGVHENFFDLGGHSLLLSRVKERFERELEMECELIEMFRHPTISRLASALARGGPGDDSGREREHARRRATRRLEFHTRRRADGGDDRPRRRG